jgi:HAD superfamily hydrolase (TIGR01549 family)
MEVSGRLLRRLRHAEVLSLDIFDTTLARACLRPEDVFDLMEARLRRAHGDLFSGFARARREIDRVARRAAWDARQVEEITLDDIGRCLEREHPAWTGWGSRLAALELETEASLLYGLDHAHALIAAARRLGKQVILVSDMYLPQPFIEAQLQAHGFTDYDRLFLSSTIGLLKSSGRLFTHVVRELGIAPGRILHVGDHPRTDVLQGRRAGLRTWLVPRAAASLARLPRYPLAGTDKAAAAHLPLPDRCLLGALARHAVNRAARPPAEAFWHALGWRFAGPVVYGYVHHLIGQLRGRGLERVYFLSRDGRILKAIYDELTAGLDDCPRSAYLYASRRALNFAAIERLDPTAEDWLAEGIRLTVGEFLARIGLTAADHAAAIRAAGFSGPEHPVVGGHEYQWLRQLYRAIEPAIIAAAAGEQACYLDYLRAEGVFSGGPFVLVDVGWMASLQRSYEAMLRPLAPELAIEGHYIGTYAPAAARENPLSRHHCWLLRHGEPLATQQTIRHCVAILEFFFAAPENTFIRIRRNGGGGLAPEFHHSHDNAADLQALAALQDGITAFARVIGHAGGAPGPGVAPATAVALLHRLLAEPTAEEARRLGDLHFADGWGGVFFHTRMARPEHFWRLIWNKTAFKRVFKQAHWPMGWYRRLSPPARLLFRILHPGRRYHRAIVT